MTHVLEAKRRERAKKVSPYMKHNRQTVKIFSNENIFTIDTVLKRRNDLFIAKVPSEVNKVFRTKSPAQVMMLGVVASDGNMMPLHFFNSEEKVGSDIHYDVLRYKVCPAILAIIMIGSKMVFLLIGRRKCRNSTKLTSSTFSLPNFSILPAQI